MENKEIDNILLKEKVAKDVVRYIYQNQDVIINIINNAIKKEKDVIEVYESIMFYMEYWQEDGISHYEYCISSTENSVEVLDDKE